MGNDHSDLGFVADAAVGPHDDIGFVPDKPPASLGQKALNAIGMMGKAVDSYGGDASTRAAIFAAQNGENPVKAAFKSYGDSDSAPTGSMIAQKAGISDQPFSPQVKNAASSVMSHHPLAGIAFHSLPKDLQDRITNSSPADVAGAGIDMMASPMAVMSSPLGGPIAKGIGKAAGFLSDATKAGPLGQMAEKGVHALGRGAAQIGEKISGVPAQDIRTYATQAPEIQKMLAEAGGSVPAAADEVREGYLKSIDKARKGANTQINQAIDHVKSTNGAPRVDASPIIDQLETLQNRLHPKLKDKEIDKIQGLLDKLTSVTDRNGKVAANELPDITSYLQDEADFEKGMFPKGTPTERAAKQGSGIARNLRNENIPGIKEPYDQLSEMRDIERLLNKNVIKPGAPEGALVAAGSGQNERNADLLSKLGNVTGSDMVGDAQRLSAARQFGHASWSPVDSTGKSVLRAGAGAGLGYGAGHLLNHLGIPIDPAHMAAAGAFVTSPAALKVGIDAGRAMGNVPGAIANKVKSVPQAAWRAGLGASKGSEIKNILDKYNRASGAGTQSGGPVQPLDEGASREQHGDEMPMEIDQAREMFRKGN